MKIAVCSDLHLEFGALELNNPGGVDVLVLSGDILVDADLRERADVDILGMNNKSNQYHTFMQHCAAEFPVVLYVAGNHEHYHGDYVKTLPQLKQKFSYLPNVHILDKELYEVNDTVFVGGTLWTDMNRQDELTMYHVQKNMNDFRCIENSDRAVNFKAQVPREKPVDVTDSEWLALPSEQRYRVEFKTRTASFCPADSVNDHRNMLDYIRIVYQDMVPWKQMVVLGHHSPSHLSIHSKYRNDDLMNGAYSSDLSEFMLDRPGIKLWTHGHTHEDFDYMIGSCRVVCNPRGYDGYEARAEHFKLKVVEL